MVLNGIELSNFLSYRELQYTFPLTGLYFIGGDNGAGKSTIIEAVSWVLFGRTVRNLSADEVVNWKVGKDCYVSLQFLGTDGQKYLVSRFRKDSSNGNALFLFRGDKDITDSSSKKTQELLDSVVGMNWQVFSTAVVFGEKAVRFAEARDSEKKEIFDELLLLHRFKEAQREVKNDLKKKEEEKAAYEADKSTGEALLLNFESDRKRLEEEQTELSRRKKKISDRVVELESEIKSVNEEKKKYSVKLEEARKGCEEIEEDRKKVRAQLNEYKEARDREVELYNSEVSKRNAEVLALQRELEKVRRILNSGLKEGDCCPTCGQEVKDLSTIQDYYEKVQTGLEGDLEGLNHKLKEARETLDGVQDKWNKTIDDLNQVLLEVDSTVEEVRDRGREYEYSIKNCEHRIEKAEYEKNSIEGDIKKEENRLGSEIKKKEEQIGTIKKKLVDLDGKISQINEDTRYLKFWETGFGNQGVKSFLIDEVVPVLNNKASYYMAALMDEERTLEFDTETRLKSGETREKFDIRLRNEEGQEVTYESCSAGEKRRIDTATLLALQDLVFHRTVGGSNIVFFDELFDSLDRTGIERVVGILEEEAKEKAIFVISHFSEFADYFVNTITIKNENGESKMEV